MTPPPPIVEHHNSIARLTVKGTFWSYLSFVTGKALTFASTVILARLLAPDQFGLMGFCLVALQYLDILNDFGLDAALISRREQLPAAANAAFYISLGTSGVLFGGAWVIAPWVADFFHEPAVTELFRVLSIVLLISGAGLVPSALIRRRLRFREKLLPDVVRNLAKGLLSISLALTGFGVWSLVWGQIAGELTSTVILWFMAGWRPTLEMDRNVTRDMLGFGGHMLVVDIGGAIRNNVDYLLVGRVLGAASLGYYTLAYRIPDLLIRSLNVVVGNVGHPALAHLQSKPEQLRQVYFNYLRYITLFTFPAGVGLAFVTESFIRMFYGAKWLPAIPVMQLVSIAIAVGTVGYIPGVLFKATSRPDILNALALVKLPVFVLVLWYCTRWGIVGVAAGHIGLACFYAAVDSTVACRLVKFPPQDMLRALAPAVLGSAMMAAAISLLRPWFTTDGLAAFFLYVGLGGAVYLATLAIASRGVIRQAGAMLRSVVSKS